MWKSHSSSWESKEHPLDGPGGHSNPPRPSTLPSAAVAPILSIRPRDIRLVARLRANPSKRSWFIQTSCVGGARQPRLKSADATTVARGDELPMNFAPFGALFLANFGECPECELRYDGVLRSSYKKFQKILHLGDPPATSILATVVALTTRWDSSDPLSSEGVVFM